MYDDFYYNDEFYNPQNLAKLNQSSLRKEYSRLRSIANKRLKEFDGTKWTETKVYKSNKGKYDQNITKMTNRDLRYKLTEVHGFLSSELSTVEGNIEYERNVISTLRENGYTGITEANFLQFTEYMERIENLFKDQLYDSRRAAQEFSDAQKEEQEVNVDEIIKRFEEGY